MMIHRKEIERFVREFLNGNYKHLNDIIDNYKELLSEINIQQMCITEETLNGNFYRTPNL